MVDTDLDAFHKLDLLERYHIPIYLGREFKDAYLTDCPLTDELAQRADTETLSVYELALRQATRTSHQARIIHSFISNFPDLAWDDWLVKSLWRQLRQQDTKEARKLLRAIGNGFATPDYRLRKFLHQRKVEEARKTYRAMLDPALNGSNPLMLSFKKIRETGRRNEAIDLERPKIVRCLKDLDCTLSVSTVLRMLALNTPAHTLRRIVAKVYGVGEDSLGSRSPLENP
jgi:hypothetical protein